MSQSQLFRKFFRDNVGLIAIALLIAVALRLFVLGAYRVPNSTMSPGLRAGDFVFGFRLPYGLRIPILGTKIPTHHMPARGDVVVFEFKDQSFEVFTLLRRVIAVAGDHVEVQKGRVRLNGQWLSERPIAAEGGFVVPPDRTLSEETLDGHQYPVLLTTTADEDQDDFLVPAGSIYVLSDDRSVSDDSRQFQAIDSSAVEARAVLTWLSLEWKTEGLPSIRWDRTFKVVR